MSDQAIISLEERAEAARKAKEDREEKQRQEVREALDEHADAYWEQEKERYRRLFQGTAAEFEAAWPKLKERLQIDGAIASGRQSDEFARRYW